MLDVSVLSNSSPLTKTFSEVVLRLRKEIEAHPLEKSVSIVILGAGPAGLMQAIVALTSGNKVTVLEKRREHDKGRIHVVAITEESRKILQEYGVYQYLVENNKIGPSPGPAFDFSVSIKDVQEAMKEVIQEIVPNVSIISYETKLDEVDPKSHDLVVKTNDLGTKIIKAPDHLILAEGCHSETFTRILGCKRLEVLSPEPVIGGIFKDSLSENKSFSSRNTSNKDFPIGLVLSTPGFIYGGRFLTEEEKKRFKSLFTESEKTEYIKERLQSGFYKPTEEDEVSVPFKLYQSPEDTVMVDQTFMRTSISDTFCGRFSPKTLYYITGDARLELDVVLGSGCNTAIASAKRLIDLFQDDLSQDDILKSYALGSKKLLSQKITRAQCSRVMTDIVYDVKQYDSVNKRLNCGIYSFIKDRLVQ